ncbi:MAG: hypothetical protein J1G05_05850 [Clostridiales bacterium]|nr:hypothetical protein [Clostridiales bacterium]
MSKLTPNQQVVADDILRYKKNKLPANLALLGLVFNCLYFMLLYAIKEPNSKFAELEIGISVILTLFTLLVAFLASEGIKGYNKKYCIVLLVLAAFQIFRIFGYPLYGLNKNLLKVNYLWFNPTSSTLEFVILVVYLCASAVCYILSAVFGYLRTVRLENFEANLANGSINVEATLKALDEEEIRQAENVISEANVTESELNLVKEDENA